jgi:diaminopimelate epimerase/GNAT superfamily N-acetyltransferase
MEDLNRSWEQFQTMQIVTLDQLTETELKEAVESYQSAFSLSPYEEAFTDEEAIGALQYILDCDGDLVLGQTGNEIRAIAGGYPIEDDVYFIEELALHSDYQGQGLGRRTLQALMELASFRLPNTLEIKTTVQNTKALNLYFSEGFRAMPITEVVPQRRQNGNIALDERVYLRKSLKEETMPETEDTLKHVAVMYPSGNVTAVVFDQRLDAPRKELQNSITDTWKERAADLPGIEQCCFVTKPKDSRAIGRVEMFGGEFCGNATRSVIQLLTQGKDDSGYIEVSGVDKPLEFSIKDGTITLEMPILQSGEMTKTVDEGVLVQLYGIAHLVITDQGQRSKKSAHELLEEILKENRYGLADQPSFGVTYYDPASFKAEFAVWVKKVTTIYDETACGSGTCAIGLVAAAAAGKSVSLEVIQPSDRMISTTATIYPATGEIQASQISGKVETMYDGKFQLA